MSKRTFITFTVETEIGVKMEVSGYMSAGFAGDRMQPPEDPEFEIEDIKYNDDDIDQDYIYDLAMEKLKEDAE